MNYIIVLIMAWGIFRLVSKFIRLVYGGSQKKIYLSLNLSYVELLFFTGYFLFLLWRFSSQFRDIPLLFSIPVLIIVVMVFWYVHRQALLGVLFRYHYNFKLGEGIKSNDLDGKLSGMYLLFVILETIQGDRIKIPYNQILNTHIYKKQSAEYKNRNLVKLYVEAGSFQDLQKKIANIKDYTLSLPYILTKHNPVITIADEKNGIYELDLVVHTINDRVAKILEAALEDKFNSKSVEL
ncbi:mechanosensitive ion channel domain-containing protein [Marinigracilibium pacificum]|uniref:Mechanosensitive ion channel n=1 Tax=Marinigracilibium pacificum TaxID=2729599 RepID=A0A848IZV0_9BACT|nr:mechanosensitive ion channel domain-containing protein [Marinigracilibium pacificum]NMM49817.1 mechanosensitive ion channel [Marinigracilibium pacificum]